MFDTYKSHAELYNESFISSRRQGNDFIHSFY